MNHCRLIYRSTATAEIVSNETIHQLIEKASGANREADITGLLVLSGRTFLQVLEGPGPAVNALFRRIMVDPRHTDVELVTFEPMGERYFDDWAMRLVDLWDVGGDQRSLLRERYAGTEDAITVPEKLHEVYAFLLDARAICVSQPWSVTRKS